MTNIEACDLIHSISCPPYKIIGAYDPITDEIGVIVSMLVTDVITKKRLDTLAISRRYIAEYQTAESLLKNILNQLKELVCHEVEEQFLLKDEHIFNPHKVNLT
jgi:hypothetical protein